MIFGQEKSPGQGALFDGLSMGYKSGRKMCLLTFPSVAFSINKTNSAGGLFQREIVACVVPIRLASSFWLPTYLIADFNASSLMRDKNIHFCIFYKIKNTEVYLYYL
jgi:hypothetical protein